MVHQNYKETIKEIVDKKSMNLGWSPTGSYLKLFRVPAVAKLFPFMQRFFAAYPFIDVFFYTTNSTHVLQDFWGTPYDAFKKHFFPLKLRPLGKYWFPTPSRPELVLDTFRFRNIRSVCKTGNLNHRNRQLKADATRNCSDLAAYHLFTEEVVIRGDQGSTVVEKLVINERKHAYVFDYKSHVVSISVTRN